ncbi:unnamed protein product, partial [Amoebophrya sp. A25]
KGTKLTPDNPSATKAKAGPDADGAAGLVSSKVLESRSGSNSKAASKSAHLRLVDCPVIQREEKWKELTRALYPANAVVDVVDGTTASSSSTSSSLSTTAIVTKPQ